MQSGRQATPSPPSSSGASRRSASIRPTTPATRCAPDSPPAPLQLKCRPGKSERRPVIRRMRRCTETSARASHCEAKPRSQIVGRFRMDSGLDLLVVSISALDPKRVSPHCSKSVFATHSITSSARPSSVSGTVRPSALAVLRLMTNSTLVACCTGRSAGFSPLRMRPE